MQIMWMPLFEKKNDLQKLSQKSQTRSHTGQKF